MLVQPQKGRKELAEVPLSTPAGQESRENIAKAPPPALSFDPLEYVQFLADTDWTESQKEEFTSELWKIVLSFVDLGFAFSLVEEDESESHSNLVSESIPMLELGINLQIHRTEETGFSKPVAKVDS